MIDFISLFMDFVVPKEWVGSQAGGATPTAGGGKVDSEKRLNPQDLMDTFQELCLNGC